THITQTSHTLSCYCTLTSPKHFVFPPDLPAPERALLENGKFVRAFVSNNNEANAATNDLSLEAALKQHVRSVYEHADHNQRRAAKLLGISRSTLARYLRAPAPKSCMTGLKIRR